MLRLFGEPEANERAFTALARFLDVLDDAAARRATRPALDPLALSFQLKLLWVSGYLPHVTELRRVRRGRRASSASPPAPAAPSARCTRRVALRSRPRGSAGVELLLSTPLADAAAAGLSDRARREALAVVTSSYEEHGGFRLRTLSA